MESTEREGANMKVTMLWHGGASYSAPYPDDAEDFNSLREAAEEFDRRSSSLETFYPCVEREPAEEGGPEAWIMFCGADELGADVYPDRLISFGPRGGVRIERV